MEQKHRSRVHGWQSTLSRAVVGAAVASIAMGVSIPVHAATKAKERTTLRDSAARKRTRESSGERGHVQRRNDVIRKESHVEKKRGWHRLE